MRCVCNLATPRNIYYTREKIPAGIHPATASAEMILSVTNLELIMIGPSLIYKLDQSQLHN